MNHVLFYGLTVAEALAGVLVCLIVWLVRRDLFPAWKEQVNRPTGEQLEAYRRAWDEMDELDRMFGIEPWRPDWTKPKPPAVIRPISPPPMPINMAPVPPKAMHVTELRELTEEMRRTGRITGGANMPVRWEPADPADQSEIAIRGEWPVNPGGYRCTHDDLAEIRDLGSNHVRFLCEQCGAMVQRSHIVLEGPIPPAGPITENTPPARLGFKVVSEIR